MKAEIIKIIAIGKPAIFWQTPPETIDLKNGTAEHIEYFAETRILNLTTYEIIDLGGNQMQGKNATYHFPDLLQYLAFFHPVSPPKKIPMVNRTA